jgi:hypothetical protein
MILNDTQRKKNIFSMEVDLNSLSIPQLKALARDQQLKIPSANKTKASIVAYLRDHLPSESAQISSHADTSALEESIKNMSPSRVLSLLFPKLNASQVLYILEAARDLELEKSVDSEDIEMDAPLSSEEAAELEILESSEEIYLPESEGVSDEFSSDSFIESSE